MTPRDFCYWLQGAFEITGIQSLNAQQTTIVRKHLELVYAAEYDKDSHSQNGKDFCDWLQGFLENVSNEMTETQTARVDKRLSRTFLHVIDVTFDNQDKLNDIHHGKDRPKRRSNLEAMC